MLNLGGMWSRRYVFASSLLICIACGEGPRQEEATPVPAEHIDSDLQNYLESYVDDAARAGVPVHEDMLQELRRVEWADQALQGDELNLGHCSRKNSNSENKEQRFRTIQIAPLSKLGLNLTSRKGQVMLKAILYHEFGQCLHDFHGHRPVEDQVIMSAELPEKRVADLSARIEEHFHMMQ